MPLDLERESNKMDLLWNQTLEQADLESTE
jgi:hypothetical protein